VTPEAALVDRAACDHGGGGADLAQRLGNSRRRDGDGARVVGVTAGDALLISVLLGLSIVVSVLPGSLTWLALR